MMPKYPFYIITYKRWDSRRTERSLEAMKIPYYLVVDGEDIPKYEPLVNKKLCTILELDQTYRETFDEFVKAERKQKSDGPARNFVWDHAIKNYGKDSKHWILDDNIAGFARLNRNKKLLCKSPSLFRAMEDFMDRYENLALVGPNYRFFASQNAKLPPYVRNTRINSCFLVRNDIPYRWRGRYQTDNDLVLRVLKDGWCTVQFNAFLQNKAGTQTVKGGLQDELYDKEGTYLKAKCLQEMHPDVVTVVERYGRPHHFIDYRPFKKNKLKLKENIKIPNVVNEYGMKLITIPKEKGQNLFGDDSF